MIRRILRIASLAIPLVLTAAAAPVLACSDSTGPDGCCKVCRDGKACGDSCISKTDSCTKGPGCACNG